MFQKQICTGQSMSGYSPYKDISIKVKDDDIIGFENLTQQLALRQFQLGQLKIACSKANLVKDRSMEVNIYTGLALL